MWRGSAVRALALSSILVLLAAACGGTRTGHVRVAYLSLTPATGFPGPPTEILVVDHGRPLARLARLVPTKLPAPSAGARDGLRICFPMDLTIGYSNGSKVVYPTCQRPRSLLGLVKAMCPLLHKRGFCFYYRNEL
jgi:hypothetical protein